MKKLLSTILMVLAVPVSAVDVGIGVSATSDDGQIHLPIIISESFKIEPSIGYRQYDSSNSSSGSLESEVLNLGLGFYGMRSVAKDLNLVYGAKVTYLDGEVTNKSTFDFAGQTETLVNKQSSSGYSFAPTLGFEYFIVEQFSVGAEIALVYSDLDLDESSDRFDDEVSDSGSAEGWETETSLVARFYF